MEGLVSSNIQKMWAATEYAKRFIGMKYIWGGDDAHDGGLDCSGLVQEAMRSVGMWSSPDATAQQIFNTLVHICTIHGEAMKGDILFFGETRSKITHIALADSDWQMVEAGGGGKKSDSGMVRIRPIQHRKDLIAILRFK